MDDVMIEGRKTTPQYVFGLHLECVAALDKVDIDDFFAAHTHNRKKSVGE